MTMTETIMAETLTGQVGNWSSPYFYGGTYQELIFDARFTSLTANAIIELDRIDPNGEVVTLWSAGRDSTTTDLEAEDIGPVDGYEVSHAFGDKLQIVITTTGTYTVEMSLQGKGTNPKIKSIAIAAGTTTPTTIFNSQGMYHGALVTSSGLGTPIGYDNASAASGKILAIIAASAPVGTRDTPPEDGISFDNGLTFAGGVTMPGLTIFYSD